ncbi:Aste57867_6250 [Aphanomyces stellatus]|uniref:Aste57867_6250 protein n=1 Tax=Aphanomyces stellatus TaxID=120398 RepID=A0A485KE14_9STRA|nr:hypothetical protein As57867_006236 [Aphanomyces stellatus]VFT83249.1 Aste57867_6250 [Aphanomyces stellatus]
MPKSGQMNKAIDTEIEKQITLCETINVYYPKQLIAAPVDGGKFRGTFQEQDGKVVVVLPTMGVHDRVLDFDAFAILGAAQVMRPDRNVSRFSGEAMGGRQDDVGGDQAAAAKVTAIGSLAETRNVLVLATSCFFATNNFKLSGR